jgi:hypothetical protein
METTRETALVLDRWNSWVRVFLPRTGEVRWIDLRRAGKCEILDGPPTADAVPASPEES